MGEHDQVAATQLLVWGKDEKDAQQMLELLCAKAANKLASALHSWSPLFGGISKNLGLLFSV